jgi:hypothetical protein
MASILKCDTLQTTAGVTYVSNGAFVGGGIDSANNITGGSAGQLLYQSAANTTSKLSVGGSSQVLVGGTTPAWTNISSLSVSSASTLTTARTINGVSFNGSANIEVNPSTGAYSNGFGARTVSTGNPSGGSNGDVWYKY